MLNRIVRWSLVTCLVCVLLTTYALAATNGTVEGFVKDAQTGDALPGANVLLLKTSLGASTDVNGKFVIRNVPPGSYTLRAAYVGYLQKEMTIQVREGEVVKKDFKLAAVGIEGQEVVVTAQAAGQKEAINQQLTAMPIVNVVSRARIQELPDANAAESVSRLPGVSLIRTGGEGSQVVIRGLSPQYNQVTIDGVEMPGNVTSSNDIASRFSAAAGPAVGDRGGDLSMISSTMLGGIEVTKAITPDMDATLLGGVVNFGLRKAVKTQMGTERDESWVPLAEVWAQGGYAQLKNTYNNYRFVASLEKRFFDQSFGVFVQANTEKRNLSSNNLGAGYTLTDKTHGDAGVPDLTSIGLNDVYRDRERWGGTVVLDYQYETGEIGFANFGSTGKTKEQVRGESINPQPDNLYFTAGENNNKLNVITNLVSIKQDLPIFHVDVKLSHSYTESENPEDLSFNFWQQVAGLRQYGDLSKTSPKVLDSYVVENPADAGLMNITTTTKLSKERTLTGNLDLRTDVNFTDDLTGRIKFGGMYQHRTRTYDYNESSGDQWYSGGGAVANAILKQYPTLALAAGGRIGFTNFIYDGYEYGEFLNGDYHLDYPINIDLMWDMLPIAKATSSLEGYRVNKTASAINDYSGYEDKSAVYAMFSLNIGPLITITPGVRYQNLTTSYEAMRGLVVPGGVQGYDTTIAHSHGYWLPMVHARYTPLEWLQIHFAYTNTLNYPDYSTITPRYLIGTGSIDYNNHNIKPATSENLDLVVSFHSNEIGLLSIDGFKKRIKDLVFFSTEYLTDLSKYPELPQGGSQLFAVNTYINNPAAIDLWGIESEWQTHFWYLPAPFSGLVFNINYTHIFSEASYPKSEFNTIYNDDGTFTQVIVDTSYQTRLLNQPNDILNIALGYDFRGFSMRVSMLYQDNIFKRPDFWMQNRVNSAKYTRWDLSVKQEMPWFGMQVYFNLMNITGEDDVDVNQKNGYPASEQRYGMSADLGVRIRL
jgi:TonB-dependent receptor